MLLKAKLKLEDGYGAFGLLLKSTESLCPSWELVFEPVRNRVCISRYPWKIDPHWIEMNPDIDLPYLEVDGPKHVERPIDINHGQEIDCKVFIHDSCVEAFLNDELVLSYRIYDEPGFHNFGAFVEDGKLTISDISINEEE